MNLAQIDDYEARLSAFLCSAWMHGGLVYRERTDCFAWDVQWRADEIRSWRGQTRLVLCPSCNGPIETWAPRGCVTAHLDCAPERSL